MITVTKTQEYADMMTIGPRLSSVSLPKGTSSPDILRKPQSGHWDSMRRFSNEVNEEISRGEIVEKTWTDRGEKVKKTRGEGEEESKARVGMKMFESE